MRPPHPITLNLYAVLPDGDPGELLVGYTETFAIPYRPSADPECEGGLTWYSEADDACYNGFANSITFKLDDRVILPDEVIWTVAFNTSDYGAEPIGLQPCSTTVAGCPYDSLNVGVESFDDQPSRGEDADENAAILHAQTGAWYCDLGLTRGFDRLRLDYSPDGNACWDGFRPLATIRTTGGGSRAIPSRGLYPALEGRPGGPAFWLTGLGRLTEIVDR